MLMNLRRRNIGETGTKEGGGRWISQKDSRRALQNWGVERR